MSVELSHTQLRNLVKLINTDDCGVGLFEATMSTNTEETTIRTTSTRASPIRSSPLDRRYCLSDTPESLPNPDECAKRYTGSGIAHAFGQRSPRHTRVEHPVREFRPMLHDEIAGQFAAT